MSPLLYLDANVFIHPVLYDDAKARGAAELLRRVSEGVEPAATCSLTLDEVAWVVGKQAGRDAALRHARLILDLPHLKVLPVRETEVRLALDLMGEHRRLSPRDAIHAASAIGAGIYTIVSDDSDLDVVPELTLRPLAP